MLVITELARMTVRQRTFRVREIDGHTYLESCDGAGATTYERWAEILGGPGVDRVERAALIVAGMLNMPRVDVRFAK